MIKFLKNYGLLVIPIFWGLIIYFFWFDDGNFVAGSDYFPAFHPHSIYNAFFSWDEQNLGRAAFFSQGSIFPYYSFWVGLYMAGFSLKLTTILWFSALLSGLSLSFYYFSKIITTNQSARAISSLFYTFNPFVVTIIFLHSYIFSLIFVPLLLRLLWEYFKEFNNKYLAWIFIIQIFTFVIFQTPALLFVDFIIVGGFTLFLFIKKVNGTFGSQERKGRIYFSLCKIIIGVIIVNSFAIFPITGFFFTNKDALSNSINSSEQFTLDKEIGLKSQETSLLNLFVFEGKWTWGSKGVNDKVYLPYSLEYKTPIVIVCLYGLLIFSLSFLLFKEVRNNDLSLFFLFFALIILIFTNSLQEPFKDFNLFLYEHVSSYRVFKEIYNKTMGVYLFMNTLLFCISFSEVFKKLENRKYLKFSVSTVLVIMIGVAGFPFLTGSVIPKGDKALSTYEINIPEYWEHGIYDFYNESREDRRVFLLPINQDLNIRYFWEGGEYVGVDRANLLIPRSIIAYDDLGTNNDFSTELIYSTYYAFYNNKSAFKEMLNIMDVGTIVQRDDLSQESKQPAIKHDESEKEILNQYSFGELRSIGELSIFKTSHQDNGIRFYIPSKVVLAENASDLSNIVSSPLYERGSAIFFNSQNSNIEKVFPVAGYAVKDALGNVFNSANLSFEDGFWSKKVEDCSRGMEGLAAVEQIISEDATEGAYSLELRSANHVACTHIVLPANLKKGGKYIFSFDHKNVKGDSAAYGYILHGEKDRSSGEDISSPKEEWHHVGRTIIPEEDINSISIYFYSPSDGTKVVINRFDAVSIEKASLEVVPLREDVLSMPPIVEYTKIDPTKYKVYVRGAKTKFPLVFLESFRKEWKIYISDTGSSDESFFESYFKDDVMESEHLLVNGYANAWIVDPGQLCAQANSCSRNEDGSFDLTLTVEFWPQRLVYLGAILSGSVLIASVGYLLFRKYKESKKRDE